MSNDEKVILPTRLAYKLAVVMAEVDNVAKRGRNEFHKYDYATESDIVSAVRRKLAEQHVILLPAVTKCHREPVGDKGSVLTHLEMVFTFIDGDSDERLSSTWLGAGTDKEDKGAYKAMTGAEKYFLLKTFMIPTGDDPEAATTPPLEIPAGRAPSTTPSAPPQTPGWTSAGAVARQVAPTLPVLTPPLDARNLISEPQRKRFFALAKQHGWPNNIAKRWLEAQGFATSYAITKDAYTDLCAALEQGPPNEDDLPTIAPPDALAF